MNRTAIAAALSLVSAPLSAHAFDLEHDATGQSVRWNGPVTFHMDGHARDLSQADALAAATRAAAHWAEAARVEVSVVAEDHHGKPGFHPDDATNVSEIIFVDEGWDFDDGVVATTLVTSDSATHQIIDADILVNEAQHRFAILPEGSTAGSGLQDDLESALTHELGHALGLAHSPGVASAVMYPSTVPGEITKRHLSDDDVSGVQKLYGAAGSRTSVDAAATPSAGVPATGCSSGVGGDALIGLLALGLLLLPRRRVGRAAVAAAALMVVGVEEAQAAEREVALRVQGVVLATSSFWRDGRIATRVQVSVQRCLEGDCASQVTYRMPGGTVGRLTQRVGELRVPQMGEPVEVALVRAHDGELRLWVDHAALAPAAATRAAHAPRPSLLRPAPRTSSP
jgi:MYXO-CTERM domain-containing protein